MERKKLCISLSEFFSILNWIGTKMTSIHFKCSRSFFCAIFVSISTLVWNQFDFFLYLFFNREKQQQHNNNGKLQWKNSNENKKCHLKCHGWHIPRENNTNRFVWYIHKLISIHWKNKYVTNTVHPFGFWTDV